MKVGGDECQSENGESPRFDDDANRMEETKMCGRITQTPKPRDAGREVRRPGTTRRLDLTPHYNGAPGQDFVAVRNQGGGGPVLEELRWGYIPSWAAQEAGREAPHQRALRDACTRSPVLPVGLPGTPVRHSGERLVRVAPGGNDGKQPYWLRPEGADMFSLAGIWESGGTSAGSVDTFIILTMAAARSQSRTSTTASRSSWMTTRQRSGCGLAQYQPTS